MRASIFCKFIYGIPYRSLGTICRSDVNLSNGSEFEQFRLSHVLYVQYSLSVCTNMRGKCNSEIGHDSGTLGASAAMWTHVFYFHQLTAGMCREPNRTGSGRAPRRKISPRCEWPKGLIFDIRGFAPLLYHPSPCSLSSSYRYDTIPLQALARRCPTSQNSSTHILPSSTTFHLFRLVVLHLSFGYDLATTRPVTQTCTITRLNCGPMTCLPYDELMCSSCLVIPFSFTLRLIYDDLQSASRINCTGSGLRNPIQNCSRDRPIPLSFALYFSSSNSTQSCLSSLGPRTTFVLRVTPPISFIDTTDLTCWCAMSLQRVVPSSFSKAVMRDNPVQLHSMHAPRQL